MIDQNPLTVTCRKCDECIAHRKRHLLGKVLAEQQTAKEVWFSTYTYGGGYENEEAYLLNYDHMQNTFKLMRRAGHRFKYLVVGEYGEEKERAHWHALIFWESTPPEMPMGERTEETGDGFWHHGYVQHEYPRSKTGVGAYCMKYMTKNNTQYRKNIKKSNNLGDKYLLDLAKRTARAGLPLFAKENIFTISEQTERARNGAQFFYPLERSSGIFERMLFAWLEEWAEVHPDKPLKHSEDTKDFLEEICQNPDLLSVPGQEYIARHLGYYVVEDCDEPSSTVLKTYYTHPNQPYVLIKADHLGVHVGLLSPEGQEVWLENASLSHGLQQDPGKPFPLKSLRLVDEILKQPSFNERLNRMNIHARQYLKSRRRHSRRRNKIETPTVTQTKGNAQL